MKYLNMYFYHKNILDTSLTGSLLLLIGSKTIDFFGMVELVTRSDSIDSNLILKIMLLSNKQK